ncbi:MAG: DUF3791 domain-containing protein [Bifidobacteriaceae bacterium]|jgi:hypothetical protein|nr:DUF3791 domain-containing protein [Bifidobacteriaceae bacterium]
MYANRLPDEAAFFLYLLEQYARHAGITAPEALNKWDAAGATGQIRKNYDIYHAEALTNAFAEIDAMLEVGQRPAGPSHLVTSSVQASTCAGSI